MGMERHGLIAQPSIVIIVGENHVGQDSCTAKPKHYTAIHTVTDKPAEHAAAPVLF